MHTSRILGGLYVVGALFVAAVGANPNLEYDGVRLPVQIRAEPTPTQAANNDVYKPAKPEGDAMVGTEDGPPLTTEKKEEEEDEETMTAKNTKTTAADDEEDDKKSTKTTGTSKTTSSVRVGIHDPVGGIQILEPNIRDPLIYKFGETITFKWNMTSVKIQPTGINVEAYNALNKRYYTIAHNLSPKKTSAEWETQKDVDGADGVEALVEDRYTLVIYDSSKNPTQVAKAGELGPYQQLSFGLYKPKKAETNEEFQCIGCSAATGVRVVMGTTLIAMLTAVFFVAGRAV